MRNTDCFAFYNCSSDRAPLLFGAGIRDPRAWQLWQGLHRGTAAGQYNGTTKRRERGLRELVGLGFAVSESANHRPRSSGSKPVASARTIIIMMNLSRIELEEQFNIRVKRRLCQCGRISPKMARVHCWLLPPSDGLPAKRPEALDDRPGDVRSSALQSERSKKK